MLCGIGLAAILGSMGLDAAQEPNRGGTLDLASTDPRVALERLQVAEGYVVNLFASEQDFPDLAKPLAMTFDTRGRLWVLTSPTYPHVVPGQEPNDKLLVLEDTNADGKADKSTVFADKLYIPTGFELGDGGVYVSQQPNLMFLRDTDGDGRADERRIILHGFGTEDSHHSIHAYTWGTGRRALLPGRHLPALAGRDAVRPGAARERRRVPLRAADREAERLRVVPVRQSLGTRRRSLGAELRLRRVERLQLLRHRVLGSPRLSGQAPIDAGMDADARAPDLRHRVRAQPPLSGRRAGQLPVQQHHRVPGHQAVSRQRGGVWLRRRSKPTPLLQSTDPNFRPVGLQFGPDGALYVIDWFNPLVGHMQYSIRDPRRDKQHGRVWRITAKDRPLNTRPRIHGQPIAAQLELLKAYEDRTRYQARLALRDRPTEEVAAAVRQWVASLDVNDPELEHHQLEALWVLQHHDLVELPLLLKLLDAKEFRARAAAVRVLQLQFDRVDGALGHLGRLVNDEAPRVRLEVVRALSFLKSAAAAEIAVQVLRHPMDYYLRYVLDETTRALEPVLEAGHHLGQARGRGR